MSKFVIARIPGAHTDMRTINPIPNVGVGFIAAVAKEEGHRVKVLEGHMWIDMNYLPVETTYSERLQFFLDEVELEAPDILGLSVMNSDLAIGIEFAKLYKSKHPETLIVMGGIGVNGIAEIIARYAGSSIDLIVKGEGEYTFKEVLQEIKKGPRKNFSNIKGVSYCEKGKWHHNPDRELIRDLDTIPLMTLGDYKYLPPNISTLLHVERGCPSNCRFCFSTKAWGSGRYFSIERIKEQGKILIQFHKTIGKLHLSDSNLLAQEKKGEETLKAVLDFFDNSIGGINLRIDDMTMSLVKLFSKYPNVSPLFGIESLSPDLLAYLGKTKDPKGYLKKAERILDLFRKYKIKNCLSFIYHIPGEKKEDLDKLYNFYKEIDPKLTVLVYSSRLWLEGKTSLWDEYEKGTLEIYPTRKPFSASLGEQYDDPIFDPFFYNFRNSLISEDIYNNFTKGCRKIFFETSCNFIG